MLSVGSVFSGIGGLELGLERTGGFEVKWQIEIDEYASRVLAKHWPHVARFRDVRDCGAHNLKTVDLICGGFPCQPHSLAGKRLGSTDERDLWGEFARLIRELKPRWVLAENVPGLLSSDNGRFFGRVLRDLAESGYDAEWDCLPAAAFGAPHIRYRVFLVAYADRGHGNRGPESRNGGANGLGMDGTHRKMADTPINGWQPWWKSYTTQEPERGQLDRSSGGYVLAVGIGPSEIGTTEPRQQYNPWATEPDVGRVVNGVSARVDRLRALGNAVVPQVAEYVGRRILETLA